MNLKKTLKIVTIWRVIVTFFAWVGIQILPFKDSFPYRETILEPFGHPLFYSWANFDGVHYLGIASDGYWANFTQAFFPVYPWLIRVVDLAVNNLLLSGLLFSHVSLIFALTIFYRLLRLDYNQKISKRSILLMLVFPTSFFFGSFYTESFFFLLTVCSFYFMRKKMDKTAYLFAAIASGTRLVGAFLFPALLYEQWSRLTKKQQQKPLLVIRKLLPASMSLIGLGSYMLYLHLKFKDALFFLNAQPAFGAERSADKLILLYQVIFRYIKMLITVDPTSLLYYTVSQEFLVSMLFLVLIALSLKKVRTSYVIFGFLCYIVPTLTGTFSSMARYVLIIFPAFVYLAHIKNTRAFKVIVFISAILLAINTMLFTRGYWVA